MKERSIISEAFMALDALNESEDIFNVDEEGVQEIKDFLANDEEDETITVFDDEAENDEELEDSYVGKVIVDCCVCHSLIYKNPDEVIIDEETDLANVDEECPYCHSTGDGYKVVGEVAPYNPVDNDNVSVEIEKKEDSDKDTDEDSDEGSDEDGDEDKEEKKDKKKEESFRRARYRRIMESARGKKRNARVMLESRRLKNRQRLKESKVGTGTRRVNESEMRSVYSMSDDQMDDWKQICRAFARKVGAKLLFVNNESMGLEFPDGTMKHLYVEDLMDYFKNEGIKIKPGKKKLSESRLRGRGLRRRRADEAFDDVQISTDTEKITIKSEPRDANPGDEMIAPISPEIKDDILDRSIEETEEEEFPPVDDFGPEAPMGKEEDVEEFDEENFNEIGESFLKKTYDNVKSFKVSQVSEGKNNSIVVEGIVSFNSGKNKKTKFEFRGDKILPSGRHRLVGENMDICGAKKAFHVNGKIVDKKFISESLNYNYTVGGKRVSGSVRAKKNSKKK